MQNLEESEAKILSYWKEHQTMDKVRAKNKGNKPFYFLDGPPFVSGDLHPAQIWTKTLKDASVRYRRYRGFDVVDRAGYDVHGLPVENRLEKELGLQSKKDIEEKIGVEKFVGECKAYVERYIGKMDADYDRFGISLDFKNPYLPYKNDYIETAWGMFKVASDRGFLYSGKRTLIYCPHCETPLSQGSMEVEYKDVDDPSMFLAFKIDEKRSKPKADIAPNSYLTVWTTTPWTLPANVAVAVNPKKLYVLVKASGKNLIIAKDRMDAFSEASKENLVVLKEFFGSQLDGVYYTSPLEGKVPMQKELRKYHKVIFSESLVSMGEGTGLVHIAPGHGIEDYAVAKLNKLPVFSPLNPDATYSDEAGVYMGIKVPAEANKIVLHDLEASGAVVSHGTVRHSYPYCWRCSSKLIFLATDQWFMNIQKIKSKLVAQNEKVVWHPEEVKEWQKTIIENSPDWCISRQRYWGIPMPIWVCTKCKKHRVLGSLEEIRKSAVDKNVVDSIKDLHRPHIDRIKLNCECGGEMERVKDILDGWFDSGITFRASVSQDQFERIFPVDLIVEYVEQIRAWFQYLMKCGVMVYGKIPFENVIVHGIMAGTDGRKMSKSFGNFRPLAEITKIFGADAFRLWSVDHQAILNRKLDENEIKNSQKVVLMLHNISNLYKEYSDAVGYAPSRIKKPSRPDKLSHQDAWIVSRLNRTMKIVTEGFEDYDIYTAVTAIKKFIIEDLSRFYLKAAKKNVLSSSRKEAKATMDIINYLLYNTLVIASPIIPFTTEEIYLDNYRKEFYQKGQGGKESIFLEEWPKFNEKLINQELEESFEYAIETITALLNGRESLKIRLRWPLANAVVDVTDDRIGDSLSRLSGIVEDYTNIKKIDIKVVHGLSEEVRPSYSKLGPDFKDKASLVANALKEADSASISKEISSNGYYTLHTDQGPFTIKPEHFTLVRKASDDNAILFKYGKVLIDPTVDEELRDEALLREFERRVQMLRKENGLKKSDKIGVGYDTFGAMERIIEASTARLRKSLNAKHIKKESKEGKVEYDIEGDKLYIGVRVL